MSRCVIDPELKSLLPKQRKFIELIAYQGLSSADAYCQAYDKTLTEDNKETIRANSSALFNKPHVQNYYQAVMEEIRDNDTKKGVWTKEVATEKLMRLIEKAEEDIYERGQQITMSRMNAILMPVKELNLMNGFNQTNVNFEGQIVQICGEDDIPE